MKSNITNNILTHRGYVLDKKKLSEDQIKHIKKRLTVKPKLGEFDDASDADKFEVFYEDINNNTITVPRYYGIKKYGEPKKTIFEGETCEFKFISKLRDYQIDIVNTCYEQIIKKGGGLLSVGCGRGKTVMGIYLAHKLKAKTLIVVHKTFLQDQWYERIRQFTDARIGLIRQDKIEIEDKDIVIAMIQSVSMRDYDIELFNKFKFVIYDEAHHCASKVFSRALYKTGANYTLALTATPDRPDGLKKVMDWYLGDVLYKEERKANKQVLAKIFKYKTNNKLFVEQTVFRMGQNKPHAPKMINNLVEIKERNTHLINILDTLRKIPERKILILSGRRDHLKLLKDTIDANIKQDIEDKKILEGETKTYYYLGGMKEKARKEAEINADILFATFEMAHEGLDIDRLNTVILTTPKKNIIQSVGRVMRRILETGDMRPIIVDFADELSIFKKQASVRLKDYEASKYDIEQYFLNKDSFISHKDYLQTNMKFSDAELAEYMSDSDTQVPSLNTIFNEDNDNNKVKDGDKTKIKSKSKSKSKKIEKKLEKGVREVSGFDDYLF